MNHQQPSFAITLKSVSKSYGAGEALQPVLDKADLQVSHGEFTAICGPSGCGKSTLLNLICGIDLPDSGAVLVQGVDIGTFKDADLARLRNEKIGFIFQSFHLVPVLSALENVCLPMSFQKGYEGRSVRVERARHLLAQVGLEQHTHKKPAQMSGGQRQRVAIARALACHPSIVLADEPTGNLDTETAAEVIRLLQRINEENKVTFVFSTHDPKIIAYAKRRIDIQGRRLVDAARAESGDQ